MDNYPTGAANDPLAPYNQPLPEEVEVLVRETLERECVLDIPVHKYQLRHYDEDLPEYYKAQEYTLPQLLTLCHRVLHYLISSGTKNVNSISLVWLQHRLEEWKPVGVEVTEK